MQKCRVNDCFISTENDYSKLTKFSLISKKGMVLGTFYHSNFEWNGSLSILLVITHHALWNPYIYMYILGGMLDFSEEMFPDGEECLKIEIEEEEEEEVILQGFYLPPPMPVRVRSKPVIQEPILYWNSKNCTRRTK